MAGMLQAPEQSLLRQSSSFLHVVKSANISRRASSVSLNSAKPPRAFGIDFNTRPTRRSRTASVFTESDAGEHGQSQGPSRREIAVMSEEEKQKMLDLFNTFDRSHTGSIDVAQLVPLLEAMGHKMNQDDAMDLLRQVDVNMNGTLEFSEFMQLVTIFKNVAQYRLYDKEDTSSHAAEGSKFTISGTSKLYWAFEGLMLLVLTYVVASVFSIYAYNDVAKTVADLRNLDGIDIAVTFVLCGNMLVRFFVGVPRKRNLAVTDGDHLFLSSLEYAKTFFVFDLISVLPLRLFTNSPWAHVVLAHGRLFAAARWPEVLDPPRVQNISRGYVDFFYFFAPMLKSACGFYLLVHTLAVLSRRIMPEVVPTYAAAYYQSMYILSGVGYGDFVTKSSGEQVFLTVACIVAILTNAVVVGGVVEFLASSDVEGTRRNRLAETLAVLHFFDVPKPLQDEILQFQDHVMSKDIQKAYGELTGHLPREIKSGLTLQFRIHLLRSEQLFARAHDTVQIVLAQQLRSEIYRPEEYIILADDTGDVMHFINYGFVDIMSREGSYVHTLGVNKKFGEEAIFEPFNHIMRSERKRTPSGNGGFSVTPSQDYIELLQRAVGKYTQSCKSITFVETMTLSADNFTRVLVQFSRFRAEVEEHIIARRRQSVAAVLSPRFGGSADDDPGRDVGFGTPAPLQPDFGDMDVPELNIEREPSSSSDDATLMSEGTPDNTPPPAVITASAPPPNGDEAALERALLEEIEALADAVRASRRQPTR